MDDEQTRLLRLSRDECSALLHGVDVGRVAFTDRGLPAVVPVTFGLSGDCIVVRTSVRSRLARLADGTVVAFEADELEPALRCGWSVVVVGEVSVVQSAGSAHHWADVLEPWSAGDREHILRLPMTVVSGRRIAPPPGGSSRVHVGAAAVGGPELW